MRKLSLVAVAVACLISAQAYAAGNYTMHIQISNETGAKCQLKDFNVIHGSYEAYPPASIMPGDAKSVDMDPFGYGPSIELTYECNGKSFTIDNRMSNSILFSKTPTGTIIRQDDGLEVTHQDISGSWWRNQPGVVNWTVAEKD